MNKIASYRLFLSWHLVCLIAATVENMAMHQVIIAKCCVCGKIRTGKKWVEDAEFLQDKILYSHTYCPTCLERVLAELEQESENSVFLSPFSNEEERLYAIVEEEEELPLTSGKWQ
jgi:UTP-glucose-1-phosphate uridylyltransferase